MAVTPLGAMEAVRIVVGYGCNGGCSVGSDEGREKGLLAWTRLGTMEGSPDCPDEGIIEVTDEGFTDDCLDGVEGSSIVGTLDGMEEGRWGGCDDGAADGSLEGKLNDLKAGCKGIVNGCGEGCEVTKRKESGRRRQGR